MAGSRHSGRLSDLVSHDPTIYTNTLLSRGPSPEIDMAT
jgi:hypothetical protein